MSVTRIQLDANGEVVDTTLEAAMTAEAVDNDHSMSITYRDVNAENEQNRAAALSLYGSPGETDLERMSIEAKLYYAKFVEPNLRAPTHETDAARHARQQALARHTAILQMKLDTIEAASKLAHARGQFAGRSKDGVTEAGLAGLRAELAKLTAEGKI